MKSSIIIYRPADRINEGSSYYWHILGNKVKFTKRHEIATKFATCDEANAMLVEIKKRLGNSSIANELKVGRLLSAVPSVFTNHIHQ